MKVRGVKRLALDQIHFRVPAHPTTLDTCPILTQLLTPLPASPRQQTVGRKEATPEPTLSPTHTLLSHLSYILGRPPVHGAHPLSWVTPSTRPHIHMHTHPHFRELDLPDVSRIHPLSTPPLLSPIGATILFILDYWQ